jgi:hypothetical protein
MHMPAPRNRVDVVDRLRKRPAMAAEDEHTVLALAIRVIGRRGDDARATLLRVCMMRVDITYHYHQRMRARLLSLGRPIGAFSLNRHNRCIGCGAEYELAAMIADPQSFAKAKSRA